MNNAKKKNWYLFKVSNLKSCQTQTTAIIISVSFCTFLTSLHLTNHFRYHEINRTFTFLIGQFPSCQFKSINISSTTCSMNEVSSTFSTDVLYQRGSCFCIFF